MTVDARVAVLYPKENELKIEEIAFPSPEPDQVIVKQFASGVCHSQLHQIHAPREKPVILGHESTGLVIDVGKNVSHVAPGDTVLVTWGSSCHFPKCLYLGRSYDRRRTICRQSRFRYTNRRDFNHRMRSHDGSWCRNQHGKSRRK